MGSGLKSLKSTLPEKRLQSAQNPGKNCEKKWWNGMALRKIWQTTHLILYSKKWQIHFQEKLISIIMRLN